MNENRVHIIDALRDADDLMEILASGAVVPIVVTGSSMSPYLKHGRDTVRLIKPDSLKKGKILFFRRKSGEFILHRLRKILPDGKLLMNGDAQSWCEIIDMDQVLGEVISLRRNGREIKPDGIGSRLWNILWYPTRAFRPAIWRTWAFVRRIFG